MGLIMSAQDRLLDELGRLHLSTEVMLAEVNWARSVLGLSLLKLSDVVAADGASDAARAAKTDAARVRAVEVEARIRDEAEAEALALDAGGRQAEAGEAWARSAAAERRRKATAGE